MPNQFLFPIFVASVISFNVDARTCEDANNSLEAQKSLLKKQSREFDRQISHYKKCRIELERRKTKKKIIVRQEVKRKVCSQKEGVMAQSFSGDY